MAANEATCLHLAAACGLEVPDAELFEVGELPVLAVRRYDRKDTPTGPARLHQEDSCQATAKPPAQKYEAHGGPSLQSLATVLRDFGESREIADLLRRTTFNMAVGNADAHAKNFSILHDADDQTVRLAPVYDVLSTISLKLADGTGRPVHAETQLAQRIGARTDVRHVSTSDLLDEAAKWGIQRRVADDNIGAMLDRIISEIPAAAGDQRVLDIIRRQAVRIASSSRRS